VRTSSYVEKKVEKKRTSHGYEVSGLEEDTEISSNRYENQLRRERDESLAGDPRK